jgi:hypothetical protein
VAKMPKRYLPQDIAWMGGMHSRLRAAGDMIARSRQNDVAVGDADR